MRIAIVDDEKHVLDRFERMVLSIPEVTLCGLFETGEQLLGYMKDNPLDAVFLDIEMPGINGLLLSEQVRSLNEHIEIIFVTAYSQYAVQAFEVQALDYILKPLMEDKLAKTIKRLLKIRKPAGAYEKPFVQCFDGFEVYLNGEVLKWKNSKAKEVLAFLVHKGGIPVSWEKIADAVWPDYNSEKAQTNFHATTYLLRKRLAEAGISDILESTRGNYRVVTDKIECDLYQLEELLNKNQMKSIEELRLIEKLNRKGYFEDNGYSWAYPRAAELEAICSIEISKQEELYIEDTEQNHRMKSSNLQQHIHGHIK